MTRIDSLPQPRLAALAGPLQAPASRASISAAAGSFAAIPNDRVEISQAAREQFARDEESGGKSSDPTRLDEGEKQEVAKLKQRDQEVRSHEQAHLSALGGEGGSASFQYETGPDGRRYAVEGEVPVSIGEVAGDPQATIEKARRVARAAIAPAQPSAADQRARARAQQVEAEARQKLADEKKAAVEDNQGKTKDGGTQAAEAATTGDVGGAATAALGLVTGLAAPAEGQAFCGVCHPDQRARNAPKISVGIIGQ